MNSTLDQKAFIMRATACVKAAKSISQGAGVTLPEADAPAVTDLANGLCVVYLVETDEGLIYVQNRHLTL